MGEQMGKGRGLGLINNHTSVPGRLVIGGYGVSGKGGVELEPLGLSLLMLARMGLEMGLETVIPLLLLLVAGRSVEGKGLVLNNAAGSRGSEEDI